MRSCDDMALDPDAAAARVPQLHRSTSSAPPLRFINPSHPRWPWQLAITTALLLSHCHHSLQLQQYQHHLLLQPYPSDPMAAADSCYPSLHHTRVLEEIAIDYTPDACHHSPDTGEIRVTYDHRGGARWRSRRRFRHGTFGARIRCPGGDTSGLNFNIYLSSLEGDKSQDEIDFEFLGKDRTLIQTNYYVGGAGGREAVHPLGFDAAEGFHEYLIRWEEGFIDWVVDGAVVRREERAPGEGWPDKPNVPVRVGVGRQRNRGGEMDGEVRGHPRPLRLLVQGCACARADHGDRRRGRGGGSFGVAVDRASCWFVGWLLCSPLCPPCVCEFA